MASLRGPGNVGRTHAGNYTGEEEQPLPHSQNARSLVNCAADGEVFTTSSDSKTLKPSLMHLSQCLPRNLPLTKKEKGGRRGEIM